MPGSFDLAAEIQNTRLIRNTDRGFVLFSAGSAFTILVARLEEAYVATPGGHHLHPIRNNVVRLGRGRASIRNGR